MIVDYLHITDHFLRRWMERVMGIDVDELMSAHYGRPSRRYTDAQFIQMLRQQGFPTAALKSSISTQIGAAPLTGQFSFGDLVIRTEQGRAVTIKPR